MTENIKHTDNRPSKSPTSRKRYIVLLMLISAFCTGCGIMDPLLPPSQKTIDRAFDAKNPDVRRRALVKISRRRGGLEEPTLAAYEHFAADEDPILRAIALDALGRAKASDYSNTIIAGLSDSDLHVRKTAADAIIELQPDELPPAALAIAADTGENIELRTRCIALCASYDSYEVRRMLMACINDPRFDVRLAAREALIKITGQDHRYDNRKWNNILKQTPIPDKTAAADNASEESGK